MSQLISLYQLSQFLETVNDNAQDKEKRGAFGEQCLLHLYGAIPSSLMVVSVDPRCGRWVPTTTQRHETYCSILSNA